MTMWGTIIRNFFGRRPAVDRRTLRSGEGTAFIPGDDTVRLRGIFGRSVRIRQVDAGSCNACEWECTALANPVYDVSRFGIDFVASPRHADLLLVTGPLSQNMVGALRQTYRATPEPRLVIGCGDCTRDGGVFRGAYGVTDGLAGVVPVAGIISGCPPSPAALIRGLVEILVAHTR